MPSTQGREICSFLEGTDNKRDDVKTMANTLSGDSSLRLDMLVASASAGLLVYSGRVLVPMARFRPQDLITLGFGSIPHSLTAIFAEDPSGGMSPYLLFPNDDTVSAIHSVIDSKVGLALLVVGTIGGVLATIIGPYWTSTLSGLDVLAAVVVFGVFFAAGWTTHFIWSRRQEIPYLFRCFFAWLEWAVGDPKAKHYDFHLTVVSTARNSGFKPLGEIVRDHQADETAIARWIVSNALKYRYAWRRDDFREWASHVPNVPAENIR